MTLALGANPSFPDLRYYRARIRERTGRVREALEDLEQALRDQPRTVDAHLLAAVCRSQLGDARGAEQALHAALALGWTSPDGLAPARAAQWGPSDWMRLLPAEPGQAPAPHHPAPRLGTGEVSAAIAALRRAVEDEPGFADRRIRLAVALLELGQAPAALRELDHALRLNPRYLEARLLAARARLECGEARRAAADLETAVAQEPRFPDLHFWLGLARFRAGDFEGAALSLESAVAINREFGRAQRLLGLVYHALGRGADALRALRRGMSRDRELARTALGAAPLLAELAGSGAAEAELRRALALQPDYPDLHFALARMRAARGDLDAAREGFRAARGRDGE